LPQNKNKKKGFWQETIETVVVAVVLALLIRTFFFQVFYIPSSSMEPTLDIGDRIIVNKILFGIPNPLYGIFERPTMLMNIPNPLYKVHLPYDETKYIYSFNRNPKRYEIIVFRYPLDPGRDFIKRVIGLSGDKVELRKGMLFINGKNQQESHSMFADDNDFGPVTVPQDHLLMLGDNRPNSSDGRVWGFLPLKNIVGKASLIIWPLNHFGFIS
jgi:signal peptidase I